MVCIFVQKAQELFDQQIYAYYFDIPFEEIMKRHQERHEASLVKKCTRGGMKRLYWVLTRKIFRRNLSLEDEINTIMKT